jgi:hypothetical protein
VIVDCCCMWKASGETIDHLLLNCDEAMELWLSVFSLFQLFLVIPKSVVELLGCQKKFHIRWSSHSTLSYLEYMG